MKVLALERENGGGSLSPQLLRAEARRVWELHLQGLIREVYFRADIRDVVLILEAQDVPSAKAVLATLPLVQSGSIFFEVIPLSPYDGFRRLFSGTDGPA